jgi:uncharacterized protein YraI
VSYEPRETDFRRLPLVYSGVCLLILLTSCSATVPLPRNAATSTVPPTATKVTITKLPKFLSPTPQICTVQTGVPSGYLNLRTGAGTDYAAVRVLSEGETLTVIKFGTWLEVLDTHGNQGYVNSNYCK